MWASPLQRSLCFNQGLNGFRNQREQTVKLENLRNTCCTGSGRLSKVAETSHWGGEERYWKLSIVFFISSFLNWCLSFAFEDICEEYCNGRSELAQNCTCASHMMMRAHSRALPRNRIVTKIQKKRVKTRSSWHLLAIQYSFHPCAYSLFPALE